MSTPAHTQDASRSTPALDAAPLSNEKTRFWPEGWWKLMEYRIGIIPLPVYFILLALIVGFAVTGKMPGEISMAIAVLAFFGFTCAELGKRLPLLRNIGAAAICATFVPSALTYYHVLPKPILHLTTEFTKSTNFLYLFIASIIVGSILSMDRRVLIRGFVKIFVPLALGSLAAAIVGIAVGAAFGLGARHTLLYIVVPIMAGGVGEGAIPLSIGYSEIMHLPQGELFAQVLPPVMLGSLTAIVLSGALDMLGKRFPHLTGDGRLQVGETDEMAPAEEEIRGHIDVTHIAAAGITAITLYLLGLMCRNLFGLPAPVAMLFLAVLVKLARAVSPQLQEGAFVVYKFFSTAVTYPLLFAIGVAMTPWDKLMAAFTIANIVTIVATVATLMGTGFLVARKLKMYPIDTAIVNACHSGQGGTGDVAILTAANRMQLMPFAQIATRIGGAIVVTVTLIAVAHGV
ncbi:CCS family citrate carrier protein [Paraburkholderia sp. GV068]|uniref:2-hydroxycarboxylate transporter family protein n=1 Tax=Paraburkholderia TaxID=1822464 RepID=UPI000D2F8DBE|nr:MULTISPECIES: 2-hydroxycarboxylate transporter family protein [Paraburkholderia]AXF07724.1 malate permease [Paraburkholderia graminis]MDR6466461.1 CCS family citrate carrier protein [Paraburkholderia graminis]MDR6474263.1 CCS family citrate carrier protein [Paraburkholderia graminis]PTQ98570.1 CCS family citrate carrier protein [Paraburkholderia sp. GV072]PUB03813.1 CCS family citrate carrier protein [Paraburkholderia sp. GV068]